MTHSSLLFELYALFSGAWMSRCLLVEVTSMGIRRIPSIHWGRDAFYFFAVIEIDRLL